MTTINRIPFGFPVNKTIESSIDKLDELKLNDFSNKNIRVKISLDKLLKKNFNQEELEKEIKEATNASKVKVVFVYDNTSNVRNQEISDQTTCKDKFIKYCEVNGIKYKDSVLEKIDLIQNDMLINLFCPSDSFELESIDLRGAIGIKDGTGRDEIHIDFNDYDEGVIALVGHNGAGKTTIIENCHPFPCMLTRPYPLKEHFCLSDSHRILIYKTSSGKRLRISMLINGTAKSVMTRYYVEFEENNRWEPYKACDGSSDSYNKFVESTFGDKSLFLRTSFYANGQIKSIPDLAIATKSEKMALFSTLAGTDYLTSFVDKSKELKKNEEVCITEIKGQLKDFDNIEERQETNSNIIEENNKKISEYENMITSDTKELNELNELQKLYITAAASYDIYRIQLKEKYDEINSIKNKIHQSESNITSLKSDLEDIDLYKSDLAWYEENMLKRLQLQKEESDIMDKFNEVQIELDKKENKYRDVEKEVERLEYNIQDLKKDNFTLSHSLPDLNGFCPVCGQPLAQHKQDELEKEAQSINNKISENESSIKERTDLLAEKKQWLKDNVLSNYKEELKSFSNRLKDIHNDIITIDTYAEKIDVDSIKDIINNADKNLKLEETKKKELNEQLVNLNISVGELNDKLSNIPTDYSDKINRLTRGLDDSRQQIAICSAEITMAQKELERIKSFEESIIKIKQSIKSHQDNIKDYDLLIQAFGNNGIQAIELDSAAPEISNIANTILNDTYGDRWRISFDTQRDSKDGRKIDDFVINVFDSKSGRNKRLDLLSTGESIWIKQALYFSFSVIRARRTGFCFKTRFLDESDGSLDSEARVPYLLMTEAAHKACNAVQTILITHSQEIKDIVAQKIEL